MQIYDIAIIGAGPAGMMAAIQASKYNNSVALLERNLSGGKKILLTGKTRCNLTNTASLDTFLEKFGKKGPFLRTAFQSFSSQDLIEFFESAGLKLKIERQGRVFPDSDKAQSVVMVLEKALEEGRIKVLYNMHVIDIIKDRSYFKLKLENNDPILSNKVVIATGGASYKATGSTGNGFAIAKKLGHTITALLPGLVPLVTREGWVKKLQGLSLKNIRITFKCGKKKLVSGIGELIFTHFGVSGPLVLDLSKDAVPMLAEAKTVQLFIDLKPGLNPEQVEQRLLRDFSAKGNAKLKNVMNGLLPQKLILVFLSICGINGEVAASQITRGQRRIIADTLKALPLTITKSLPLEEAMVTAGGVLMEEINPRTMESRIIPGLYFAGEVIEGCAPSGGYNLQQAFSTGYLAGASTGMGPS